MANRQAQLNALASKNGYHEGANNANDFTVWQTDGAWRGAAWCDSFAQWGAAGNGGFVWQAHCQFGVKGDAYCPWSVNHAKEYGIWHAASEKPEPGWQVLFSWNRNGLADHIGTVWDAKNYPNGNLVTIEGNSADQVRYCLRDSTYIMGFIAIPADVVVPPVQVPVTPPTNDGTVGRVEWPVLSISTRASQALYTKVTQKIANVKPDGDYYTGTRSAVINWQRAHGLQADGVVGLKTATAIVQAWLNFFGCPAGAVDGDCGVQTTAGIRDYQAKSGLTVDGVFGYQSTLHLAKLCGIA